MTSQSPLIASQSMNSSEKVVRMARPCVSKNNGIGFLHFCEFSTPKLAVYGFAFPKLTLVAQPPLVICRFDLLTWEGERVVP